SQLGFYILGRRLDEFRYVKYIQGEYLPRRWERDKRWPSTLGGVERDLEDLSEPRRHRGYAIENLLAIHRAARPVLAATRIDATSFKGTLTFKWSFGKSYEFESRKPDHLVGGS